MAASKKKKLDPIKERERRAKIFAGVGCVLLIAIGAYEVPHTMKMMKHSSPPPRTPVSSSTAAGSSLPNVSGGAVVGASASPSTGELANTDLAPPAGAGQLVSFSVFQTKNPFVPQVPSTAGSTTGGTTTTAQQPTTSTTPTTTTPTTTTPSPATTTPSSAPGSVVPPAPGSSTTTLATQPTVAISVNGVVSHVGSQGTFPTGAPVFRLVSWTKGAAQIGIVGGSYATGDGSLTLTVGTPVTLENQTDAKRYRLELLSTP